MVILNTILGWLHAVPPQVWYTLIATVLGAILGLLLGKVRQRRKSKEQQEREAEAKRQVDAEKQWRKAEAERLKAERKRLKEERRRAEAEAREAERRAKEEEERRREEERLHCGRLALRETLAQNNILARAVQRKAGLTPTSNIDKLTDLDIDTIIREIPAEQQEIIRIAAERNPIRVDVARSVERRESIFPENDMEPRQIRDIGEIARVVPADMALDDDEFFERLAEERLMVMQGHVVVADEKVLYLLLDVSPSMEWEMQSGVKRRIWARGVVIGLLTEAVRGKAKYFLRPFGGHTGELLSALTPADAEQSIGFLMQYDVSIGSTNIAGAVQAAINDIRSKGGEFSRAEIVLISDGGSSSEQNPLVHDDFKQADADALRTNFGDDIRLHTVLISGPSEPLKSISATYQVFQ